MTEHPNVVRIKDGYTALANGDFAALNNLLAEDVVWHFGGRNQLCGDYRGRDAVYGFLGRLMELTYGTVRMDVHAVVADDEHAVALIVGAASRGARTNTDEKVAHIYHLRDGKVTEFWYAPTDQYVVDELLG
jgi:uncharacterized protein